MTCKDSDRGLYHFCKLTRDISNALISYESGEIRFPRILHAFFEDSAEIPFRQSVQISEPPMHARWEVVGYSRNKMDAICLIVVYDPGRTGMKLATC